jgi:DNA-directed RNA polymerase subunit beta'
VGAVFGLQEPLSPQLAQRNVQGFISRIAGQGSPKAGFFQSRLVRRQMDISGRGTIVPDATLAMDEVGLPEDAGWSMYAPFIMRGLVNRGYGANEAKKLIEDRHPTARDVLINETKSRPVFINRAPTLYRYNMIAAYPKLVPGKTIRTHEALPAIQRGDYDGDALTFTVPVLPAAVEEARLLTLPNMLLSDQKKNSLSSAAPQQEAVLGIYKATNAKSEGKTQYFDTKSDALAAYHRGEITLGTPVEIKKK